MRIHWLGRFGAVMVALAPVAARAEIVPPHDGSFTDGDCSNCHSLFDQTALGAANYSDGCNSCHANVPATSPLALPRSSTDEAKPGKMGTHHSWSGFAENPAAGAIAPPGAVLRRKLSDGRLQCVVCHDLHNANAEMAPASRHTSIPVNVPQSPLAGATGSATMTLVEPGTVAHGYRLRLQGGTSFIITKTARALGGTTWLNWVGGAWIPGTVDGPGKSFAVNTPVAVEGSLTVQWSAGGAPGDLWEFFVSYPGLRMTMNTDYLCTYCHKPMGMGFHRVAGADTAYLVDGVRTFSHPVGEGLNANGLGTDHAAILDANGLPQGSGDANATNDLKLDGSVVRCTTCHAVHGADSNSQTVDVR